MYGPPRLAPPQWSEAPFEATSGAASLRGFGAARALRDRLRSTVGLYGDAEIGEHGGRRVGILPARRLWERARPRAPRGDSRADGDSWDPAPWREPRLRSDHQRSVRPDRTS